MNAGVEDVALDVGDEGAMETPCLDVLNMVQRMIEGLHLPIAP